MKSKSQTLGYEQPPKFHLYDQLWHSPEFADVSLKLPNESPFQSYFVIAHLDASTLTFAGEQDREELHFSEKQRLEQFQVHLPSIFYAVFTSFWQWKRFFFAKSFIL